MDQAFIDSEWTFSGAHPGRSCLFPGPPHNHWHCWQWGGATEYIHVRRTASSRDIEDSERARRGFRHNRVVIGPVTTGSRPGKSPPSSLLNEQLQAGSAQSRVRVRSTVPVLPGTPTEYLTVQARLTGTVGPCQCLQGTEDLYGMHDARKGNAHRRLLPRASRPALEVLKERMQSSWMSCCCSYSVRHCA